MDKFILLHLMKTISILVLFASSNIGTEDKDKAAHVSRHTLLAMDPVRMMMASSCASIMGRDKYFGNNPLFQISNPRSTLPPSSIPILQPAANPVTLLTSPPPILGNTTGAPSPGLLSVTIRSPSLLAPSIPVNVPAISQIGLAPLLVGAAANHALLMNTQQGAPINLLIQELSDSEESDVSDVDSDSEELPKEVREVIQQFLHEEIPDSDDENGVIPEGDEVLPQDEIAYEHNDVVPHEFIETISWPYPGQKDMVNEEEEIAILDEKKDQETVALFNVSPQDASKDLLEESPLQNWKITSQDSADLKPVQNPIAPQLRSQNLVSIFCRS